MSPEPLWAAHKTSAATRLNTRTRCCTRITKVSPHKAHLELLNPLILRELQASGDLQNPVLYLSSSISSACPDPSMSYSNQHHSVSKRSRIGSHQARDLFGSAVSVKQSWPNQTPIHLLSGPTVSNTTLCPESGVHVYGPTHVAQSFSGQHRFQLVLFRFAYA